MTVAVYPGSFDPVTNGHLDIITRASRVFETVIMAVYDGPSKKNRLFNITERLALLQEATRDLPRVKLDTYSNLTIDYVRSVGASVIVRGVRVASDFEYEFQIGQIYQTQAPNVDVVLFMANHQYTFYSSSMVKEIASMGGDVAWMVPQHVAAALQRVYSK